MSAQPAHEAAPAEHGAAPAGHAENPLEHIVQHPLIERPADLGPLTPNGVITLFSDQIAMLEEDSVTDPTSFFSDFGVAPEPLARGLARMLRAT